MREETRLFTRHLIDSNLDIVTFLDSDFTYVNRPLARLYGLKLPEGSGFERVSLTDRRRGGLLGQKSVLTVTANGVDTSSGPARCLAAGKHPGNATLTAPTRRRASRPRYPWCSNDP